MSQLTADALLLLVTLAWGTTFVIVKNAIAAMGPLTFIAVRFLIAGSVLLAWHVARAGRPRGAAVQTGAAGESERVPAAGDVTQVRTVRAPDADVPIRTAPVPPAPVRPAPALPAPVPPAPIRPAPIRPALVPPAETLSEAHENAWYNASGEFYLGGVLTGLALFFSYATQTLGIVTVAAGKAAFITGLYVVIVPIASRAILRSAPDRNSVIGVILATAGMGLLSLKLPLQIASGDFLVFLCAVGFAAHILLVGHYSEYGDPVLFAAIQLLVVSAGSLVWALIFERPFFVPKEAWGAILFTAIAATSFAFLTQSAVQRFTSATHTALIFSAEPVFGALFAWLLAGELLVAREFVGAGCILAGMLVSESDSLRSAARGGGRDDG